MAGLVGLVLSGCVPQRGVVPSLNEGLQAHLRQGFELVIEPPPDGWLSADPALDGERIASAGEKTSRHLSSTMQGVANSGGGASAGAVVAGSAIGSILLANLSRSGIQREAQEAAKRRVEPLNQALLDHDWQEYYQRAFGQALKSGGYAPAVAADLRLRVVPRLRFSDSLQVLRLVSEVRLVQGKQTLYAGRIESFAEPVSCDDCLELWRAQGAAALHAAAGAGVEDTAALLVSDWHTQRFVGVAGQEQTLRYQLGTTRHVERGRLLALGTSRSVFLSLHGWLKSMPVGVEAR